MFQIIPAIDLIEGQCVRLTQGDYAQKKVYSSDPLEVAKAFEGAGIKRLHLVDLDGAKAKKIVNIHVLERIAQGTSLHIDFGGGVQSDEMIDLAFSAGAAQITAGSIAVKNPALVIGWFQKYGAGKIIVGADAHQEQIAVSGWQENSNISIFDFLSDYENAGARYIISTDVAKDGLLQGPSFELYKKIQEHQLITEFLYTVDPKKTTQQIIKQAGYGVRISYETDKIYLTFDTLKKEYLDKVNKVMDALGWYPSYIQNNNGCSSRVRYK